MAGSKMQFLSKALLDHVLGNTAYTAPGTVYIALSLSAFDPTLTGSTLNEPAVGAYARVAVTNNTTNWPNATSAVPAVKSNANDINFPTATADWGTPLAAYVCDASSAGNALYGCDISGADPVLNGAAPGFRILAGTFIFQED